MNMELRNGFTVVDEDAGVRFLKYYVSLKCTMAVVLMLVRPEDLEYDSVSLDWSSENVYMQLVPTLCFYVILQSKCSDMIIILEPIKRLDSLNNYLTVPSSLMGSSSDA